MGLVGVLGGRCRKSNLAWGQAGVGLSGLGWAVGGGVVRGSQGVLCHCFWPAHILVDGPMGSPLRVSSPGGGFLSQVFGLFTPPLPGTPLVEKG